jgi:hypothetical protein
MLREALYNSNRCCCYQEAWFSRGGEKAKFCLFVRKLEFFSKKKKVIETCLLDESVNCFLGKTCFLFSNLVQLILNFHFFNYFMRREKFALKLLYIS